MELRIKSLKRTEWKRVTKKEFKSISINNEKFIGKVGYLKIIDLEEPLFIDYPYGKVKIADRDYKWLQFAPQNQNWWLTVMYDEKDSIIESYFDITKENNFDDNDSPYFIDMKLDVVIPGKGLPIILDEDELNEALNNGLISLNDYEIAYNVANEIIEFYNNNSKYYYEQIEKFRIDVINS